MSIIYEALKKLENKDKPIKKSKKRYIFIISVFLACALLVYFFKYSNSDIKEKPKLEDFPKGLIISKKSEVPPLDKKENKYKLEGIMFDNRKPVALINKKILTVGDKIEDAEILNIYPDKVELKTQDGIEYLTLE